MSILRLGIPILLLLSGVFSGQMIAGELTAEEIMDKVDQNVYFSQAKSHVEMTIRSGRRQMVKEMVSYGRGDWALVEFTNPGDRGTKYLKLDDELWMFFPDAEDLVKISGHMLKQGFMGSDMSYEDMLVSEKMTELYVFEVVGQEMVGDRLTYVIRGTAKEGAEVSYAIRQMWIDAERFLALQEELYAVSGRLLKVTTVEEYAEIDGRNYPVVITMEDKLKRNSQTTLRVLDIDFDVEIPDDLFSLQTLMR